jgi:hypothetical protein
MTVFVAHAPKDAPAAEAIESFLERRGQFVERDDGQTALRPITPHDVMVLLISNDLLFAPMRLRLEQRALDAWTDGRLVLVKLDHGIAPVGLRDLPAIDASAEAQREFKWLELANAIREKLRPAPRGGGGGTLPSAPMIKRKGGGLLGAAALAVLALPGIAALAAGGSIWLVNRIGPTPGTWADLIAGIDALGARAGAPAGVAPGAFAGAILLTLLIVGGGLLRLLAGGRAGEPAPAPDEAEPATAADASVFVSYARANQAVVLPVIEAATQGGRKFWLDQQGLTVGEGWAGEIVRAIRGAAGVIVMCSKAAFESDHVKREVYLADRYHRKLIPIFIEEATPPEDFEYFFAGVQHVNLYETPEGERPEALVRVLGEAA